MTRRSDAVCGVALADVSPFTDLRLQVPGDLPTAGHRFALYRGSRIFSSKDELNEPDKLLTVIERSHFFNVVRKSQPIQRLSQNLSLHEEGSGCDAARKFSYFS